jgi:hypothetical protein
MARIDKIKQALKGLEPEDKLNMWNEYCSENGDPDNQIYENDEEFFNLFYANDVFGAVQRAVYGEYNPMHDFVTFNGYANLESISSSEGLERYIDDNELAEYIDGQNDISDYLDIEDEEANEVSEEAYYDALEVLPPYYFDSINGKKVSGGFAVGEPTSHSDTPIGYRATYSGFYKKDGKYFGVGEVYFVFADEQGEPNDQGSANTEVKTLIPDAFGNGGGVRRVNGKYYPIGSSWTKEHKYENKSSKYEVPQADRKRKFSGGGGVPNLSSGYLKRRLKFIQDDVARVFKNAPEELLDTEVKGWETIGTILDNIAIASDITDNESDDWRDAMGGKFDKYETGGSTDIERYKVVKIFRKSGRREILEKNLTLDQARRVVERYPNSNTSMVVFTKMYAQGGGLKKPTYIPNEDIESLKTNYGQTISGRKLLDGAYATGKVKKPTMSRTQFEDESYEYGNGGFVSKGELVWKKITDSTKAEFLYENFTPQITPRTQETLVGKSWNFLPKDVKIVFQSKYANVEDYGTGGKPTTNEGIINAFLNDNREFKVGNITTHYSTLGDVMLLRNYGTLIAKRKGFKVSISNKNYSKSTSAIQNMIFRLGKMAGLDVVKIDEDKFEKGGKSKIAHYKVDGEIFIDYMEAVAYCDKHNCSYDKIVKTKEYGTGGTMDSSTFKKGGYTPKEPIAFSSSNLYFNGYAMDINGNSVVRVSFPNSRAFSIQTNGTLPKTNNAYGTIGFNESEINSYVKSYGSPAQKKKLKIYKK